MNIKNIFPTKRMALEVAQAAAILPTSWTLFVSFCTVFSVVELLGPFFRGLIFYWKTYTRDCWDTLFSWINFSVDINLNDSDKDGLTFALFFFIFGLSAWPKFIKILRSASNEKLRKVNWSLFPIASFVSMAMVTLVVYSTTDGTVYSSEATVSIVAQTLLFFSIMAIVYALVAFVPNFTSYIVSYVLKVFGRPNTFIIVSALVIGIYVVGWALWIPGLAGELNLMSSGWVTAIVIMVCLYVPMWMPIVQPEKLLKLAFITFLIGVISSASLGLDYIKLKASVPGYSYSIDEKERIVSVSESCKRNNIVAALLYLVAQKQNWQGDPLNACDCVAAQIVGNESIHSSKLHVSDFGNFMKLSDETRQRYLARCISM